MLLNYKFFIYHRNKHLIIRMLCKYFLLFFGLSLHFLKGIVCIRKRMFTYEPYLLSELEPPHLALYYSFCFGCIRPAWTIGLWPFWGPDSSLVLLCPIQSQTQWPPSVCSCAAHAPILPSREGLVDPQFAQQHIRNIGHDIQPALWLFFLNSRGEFRRVSWKNTKKYLNYKVSVWNHSNILGNLLKGVRKNFNIY